MNKSQLRFAITSHLRQSSITQVDIKYYVELASNLIDASNAKNIKQLPSDLMLYASNITTCEVKKQQYQLVAQLLLDIRFKRPTTPFEHLTIHCPECGETTHYSYAYYRYECKNCKTHVRAHKGDHWPMGSLVNSKVSYCRRYAHHLFDEYWVEHYGSPSAAYEQLAKMTGVPLTEIHFGTLINSTLDAYRINQILSSLKPLKAA